MIETHPCNICSISFDFCRCSEQSDPDNRQILCEHYWREYVWEPGIIKCMICGKEKDGDGDLG